MAEQNQATFKMVLCGDGGTVSSHFLLRARLRKRYDGEEGKVES
jgi:hypothetical protein